MKRVLLLHLSDIHIKGASDPILRRIDPIVSGVRGFDDQLDMAIILVSGDLAYSGTEGQFIEAWEFLDQLKSKLELTLSSGSPGSRVPTYVAAVPGNHDCDFSSSLLSREAMIEAILRNNTLAQDNRVIDVCAEVHEAFFESLIAFGSEGNRSKIAGVDGRLGYEYRFDAGSKSIRILCFNTAWLSQKQETPAKLHLPPAVVPTGSELADVVIAMFHHPYNWLEPSTAREFKQRLERIADLIFTGHEHDSVIKNQQLSSGERNLFLEGSILQDSTDETISGFNLLVLDIEEKRQRSAKFEWDGNLYVSRAVESASNDELSLGWEELQVTRHRCRGSFDFTSEFQALLNDPGVDLRTSTGMQVKLSDIFIDPDLQESTLTPSQHARSIRGSDLVEISQDVPYIIVSGDRQSGKSCLAKTLSELFRQKGYVPILVDSSYALSGIQHLNRQLTELAKNQYGDDHREAFAQLDRTQRVVLIDDFHLRNIRGSRREEFVQALTRFAGRVILFSSGATGEALETTFETVRIGIRVQFSAFRIIPMGHLRREDLVEKWLLLDRDLSSIDLDFAFRRDKITKLINGLIGKHWLPRYPVYLLAIMQAEDNQVAYDPRIGTFGAYYELFIRGTLQRNRGPIESGKILSFLAFLAHKMYTFNRPVLDQSELNSAHKEFEEIYDISLNLRQMINELAELAIVDFGNESIRFRYPYLYYYFAARWFADHISDENVGNSISALCKSVSIGDNSNILLFLSHLSRDSLLVSEMLAVAQSLFPDVEPVKLSGDVGFFEDRLHNSQSVEFFETDFERERKERLARQDEYASSEDFEAGHQSKALTSRSVVEILGQFLKNFPATLDAETKEKIATECYLLGLRQLKIVLDLLESLENPIRDLIRAQLLEKVSVVTEEDVEEETRVTLLFLAELCSTAVIRTLADSVGSSDLRQTYERVERSMKFPSVRLINAVIRLEQAAEFPETFVLAVSQELSGHPLAGRVLKWLIVLHFHLVRVGGPTKQRVCSRLGIAYTQAMGANPALRILPGEL